MFFIVCYHSDEGNFAEAVQNRLMKYAENLEVIVNKRTHSLLEEKRKTESLLYRLLPMQVENCLFLIPFPKKPWFSRVFCTSPLKTLLEMEKLLITSNFSFSHSVFYPFGELSSILNKLKIVVCKHFLFRGVYVWERVNLINMTKI